MSFALNNRKLARKVLVEWQTVCSLRVRCFCPFILGSLIMPSRGKRALCFGPVCLS